MGSDLAASLSLTLSRSQSLTLSAAVEAQNCADEPYFFWFLANLTLRLLLIVLASEINLPGTHNAQSMDV